MRPSARDLRPPVFLSHSRQDLAFVKVVQQVLEAGGIRTWRDSTRIPYGVDWKAAVDSAIRRCDRMLVFWCSHAYDSNEVEREYHLGLHLEKLVCPVIIGSAPMPTDLGSRNALDLRPILGFHHELGLIQRFFELWIPFAMVWAVSRFLLQ